MKHTEEAVRAAIAEPADGTRLTLDLGEGEWRTIWRDDKLAGYSEDRWFDNFDGDPMSFYEHLKYAKAVYVLGDPAAVFA
jgi:hypothetical protein